MITTTKLRLVLSHGRRNRHTFQTHASKNKIGKKPERIKLIILPTVVHEERK
jgi:hypothetical protein